MATFSIPIARLAEKVKVDLETVTRKATADVFRAVVQKSPVDTGRFKANWNVSQGVPDETTTTSTNAARGEAEAAKALVLPAGGVAYICNALGYARRLEYGWSKQAPSGMIRTSAVEFSDYVQRAIKG